ncbi:MAG TPA: HWE histidine kinase domain-containing protein [Allosphingosinicella sp.]|nr:HWE histidine kinase domain-containing protein [Allosphingosinicella sp.]
MTAIDASNPLPDLRVFLAGGGDMAALIRARDWSGTELGPIGDWPQSLRSALSIALRSPSGAAIFWGADHLFLYNDAWAGFLGERHPWALGRRAEEVLADIWPVLERQFHRAYEEGEAVNLVDALLERNLGGVRFTSWWSYSLLPIAGEDGRIGGLLGQARETTESVLRRRRDALMVRLGDRLRPLDEPRDMLDAALEMLSAELGVARLGYGEVDEASRTIDILACAGSGELGDISGSYSIEMTGESFHAVLGRGETIRIDDVAEDPVMRSAGLAERYRRHGIVAALVVPVISAERYRAMLFAHEPHPRRWQDGEQALLRAATDQLWREMSRARAQRALKRSEERYRRIFEQANDVILTADLDQVITDVNPAAASLMEAPRDAIVGQSMHEFLTPQSSDQARRMLRHKLDHGGTTHHELCVRSSSGRLMNWEINSTLTLDDHGEPVGLHAIARDVTERHLAEERQRLLVNELNHRVKNTLALVQGLALQSFREGRDPAEARDAFQQRLAALAAAHDLLTRERWESATLAELVREAVGHVNAQEPRLTAEGPEATLGPKAAVSLVMALHELATNAAKYGAFSRVDGKVEVRWQIEGEQLRLEWRERDGPPVAPPERRGFGLRMIERALAADLGGTVAIDFAPEGLACRVEAPLGHGVMRRER